MSSLSNDLLVNPQDLFDISVTTAQTQLGALATTGDGRYFRYALAGATALVPGTLQQGPAETTAHERLAMAAAAVGATSLTTTASITVTANQYTGGYAMVAVTPGIGQMFQIGTHPATTSAALTFNIVDPVITALTTSSTVSLVANPYAGVIINPTTATGTIAGVAVAATPIAGYGWIQTKGPSNVLAQGTVVVGEEVAASSTTAGCVVATSGVLASVGVAMQGITATQNGPIFLNIS